MHGISTRHGGVSRAPFDALNLGLASGDEPAAVAENRRRVGAALGFADGPVFARQVHGTRVAVIEDPGEDPGEADALVTARRGVLLGVLGADCPGVVLAATSRPAVAVVHAGWRGVAGGIVGAALTLLASRFGVEARHVHAGIGPGISGARYEVSAGVAAALRASLGDLDEDGIIRPGRPGHAHVDLVAAIEAQLAGAGVGAGNVRALRACTFDDAERWFSHRRDGPRTGRHAVVAALRA